MSELGINGPEQIYAVLKGLHPFSCLNEPLLKQIAADTAVKYYPRDSYVFKRGEKSQQVLFLVIEGQARILAATGEKQTTAVYRNPGEFFGETVFLTADPYPGSVSAAQDLVCLLISAASFSEAMGSNRAFADYFTKILTARLNELYRSFLLDSKEGDLLSGQPMRRRVEDVAVADVVTCLPLAGVKEIAARMSKSGASSVIVVAPNQKPIGIITQKDLVSKVLAAENPNLNHSAYEIMSGNLITVNRQDFVYQALLLMVKHRVKHLVVTGEKQRLYGILTVQDLFRASNTVAMTFVNRIEQQESIRGMAELMIEIDNAQRILLSERAYASEICALVTEFYDRVTRKVILLAETEMTAEGRGAPPVKYCFINMGSSGRKEQFSRTDQDNGIIYQDPAPGQQEIVAAYFLDLGEKIAGGLELCGFSRCTGGVMSNNRRWCRGLSGWRAGVRQWVERLEPENVRDMTIFLDFRYLVGETELFEQLRTYVARLFQKSHHALLFMAKDDLRHRVPLNMFRQIVTERSGRYRKKINLKSTAAVHILDCVRLFALREGIKNSNTFERIRLLKERGIFKPDEADSLAAAYETIMMLRIRDAVQKQKQGIAPDNYISPGELDRKEQSLLKESLLVINRLQMLTAHTFRVQSS